MKKLLIAGTLLLVSGITALSFNQKNDDAKEIKIEIEKNKISEQPEEVLKRDISTID